jgi:hypothetical protein
MNAVMPRIVVTRSIVGIAHMQVCAEADVTDEEILAVCNRENPSGTEYGWSRVCRADDEFWGKTAPTPCADDPTRTHFLVAC